jgi:hypothetical protein
LDVEQERLTVTKRSWIARRNGERGAEEEQERLNEEQTTLDEEQERLKVTQRS